MNYSSLCLYGYTRLVRQIQDIVCKCVFEAKTLLMGFYLPLRYTEPTSIGTMC